MNLSPADRAEIAAESDRRVRFWTIVAGIAAFVICPGIACYADATLIDGDPATTEVGR